MSAETIAVDFPIIKGQTEKPPSAVLYQLQRSDMQVTQVATPGNEDFPGLQPTMQSSRSRRFYLYNLDQLYLEGQLLTGKRMVGVECNLRL